MHGAEDKGDLARGQVTRTADVEQRQRVEEHGVDTAQLLAEEHEHAREEGPSDAPQDIPCDLWKKASRVSRLLLRRIVRDERLDSS